ncbi:MAG TPA: lipopolysaccharide core heptose(II) kinase RfaY [Abditibacteriaceae bacterium]|jgi:aminoglycoside phosphotransferase (APT) family kinase protein
MTTKTNARTADNHLTRGELEKLSIRSLHAARNWSKAEVALLEWPPGSGQRVVVKDLRRRPLWYRLLAGRYSLTREWKAMRALEDLPAVPRVIARPDADCIVMEFRDGQTLMDVETLSTETVQALVKTIEDVHGRGVTHGDLHRSNLLLAEDGSISVIDWATACVFGPQRRAIKGWTFNEWRALDRRAIAKVKAQYAPQLLSPEEHDLLVNGSSTLYRKVKNVRHVFELLRGRVAWGAGRGKNRYRDSSNS